MKYSKVRQSMDEMIASHGWALQAVFDPEGKDPSFVYTVGLAAKNQPELIVFGMDGKVGGSLLNTLGRRITTEGVPALDTDIPDMLEGGYPLRLIEAPRSETDQYMFATKARYPGYTALQLVWTDMNRRWPWEIGFDPKLVGFQPILRNHLN
jgi:hypothetical protein